MKQCCKNCGEILENNSNYCASCGQSVLDYKQPFFSFFKQLLNELLDIDGRMFTTLRVLFQKPGELTIAYNEGKRTKYSPPFRMYIIISVLYFMTISFSTDFTPANEELKILMDAQYPRIMFVLLPVFALLMQLLFKNTYYISNLIFSVHIHCISYLMLMLIMPLEALADQYLIFIIIQSLLFIYMLVYLFLAIKNTYNCSWHLTLLKFVILMLSYLGIILGTFNLVQNNLLI